ncbi:hypothetical protein E4U27_005184 [Claviceps purpurea]|nr:hypothetical protein E4U27_005184 [Claviceps purpurea]
MAIGTRTCWTGFVMDCMVNSSLRHVKSSHDDHFRCKKKKSAWPLSAVEFAFGTDLPPQVVDGNHSIVGQSSGVLDVTQSFEILVGGFDIWAQVRAFIFNGRRRAPGICAPHNCPWLPSSPSSQSLRQLDA